MFKFYKPHYHKTDINYKKACFINIIRSIYVNKLRYFSRLYSEWKAKRYLSKIRTTEELAKITAICRPGKLEFGKKN